MKLTNQKQKMNVAFTVFALIFLIVYPMRHISWGLDLWDTGYNYGNFLFLGKGYMDSMWFFSTYLANIVGHLFTCLPFGDTLIGMNLYTGLLVSLMAVTAWLFCTKIVKIPAVLAFFGEVLAIGMCWCPTALLYNYLTYLFFLLAVICIYQGLLCEKRRLLFIAGILLGINVFVRFSNLPEAALILAVWYYDFYQGKRQKDLGRRMLRDTLCCLGGYVLAVLVFLLFIAARYGFREYVDGISRLFAMTEVASDYQASSMLKGMVWPYINLIYWIVRILVFVAAGFFLDSFFRFAALQQQKNQKTASVLQGMGLLFSAICCVAMVVWLYKRHGDTSFCSLLFYSYDPIYRPAALFMLAAMGIAFVKAFWPGVAKEEKLFGVIVIGILLLTSLGSNNNIYPSMNNLFLAAPYVVWQVWKLVCFAFSGGFGEKFKVKKLRSRILRYASVRSLAMAGVTLLLLCSFQFLGFGACFTFAEATGVQDISAYTQEIRALEGVSMSREKAQEMEALSEYLKENALTGQSVVLYGNIPSLAFYLNMQPASNPWCDLASYGISVMEEDFLTLSEEITGGRRTPPVVIVKENKDYETTKKWEIIQKFLTEQGYSGDRVGTSFCVYVSKN